MNIHYFSITENDDIHRIANWEQRPVDNIKIYIKRIQQEDENDSWYMYKYEFFNTDLSPYIFTDGCFEVTRIDKILKNSTYDVNMIIKHPVNQTRWCDSILPLTIRNTQTNETDRVFLKIHPDFTDQLAYTGITDLLKALRQLWEQSHGFTKLAEKIYDLDRNNAILLQRIEELEANK